MFLCAEGELIVLPFRRGHLLVVYTREILKRTREAGDD